MAGVLWGGQLSEKLKKHRQNAHCLQQQLQQLGSHMPVVFRVSWLMASDLLTPRAALKADAATRRTTTELAHMVMAVTRCHAVATHSADWATKGSGSAVANHARRRLASAQLKLRKTTPPLQ